MAVSVVGVELRLGRPAGACSAPAVSELPALARRLGWLLALATRAVAGRAHLDSPWSVFNVSAIARAAAGSGAGAAPRRRCDHRQRVAAKAGEWAGAAADCRAARCSAHHAAVVAATLPSTVADVAGRVYRTGSGSGRNRGLGQRHW